MAAGEEVTARSRVRVGALLVATVGPMALAPLVAPAPGTPPSVALGGLLFVGSALHYAVTGTLGSVGGLRAAARSRPGRFVVLPVSALVVGACVTPFLPTTALDVALYLFFAWQFLHFARQNIGVACLSAASRGAPTLTPRERTPVMVAAAAGVIAVISRPSTLQLPAVAGSGVLHAGAVVVFVLAVLVGIGEIAKRPRRELATALPAVYLASLLFSLPCLIFTNPYAALAGMTIAHGLQYIVIVGTVVWPRRWTRATVLRVILTIDAVFVAAVVLHLSSRPSTGGTLSRDAFGIYLGVAMAHFVVDRSVWKMRDPQTRAVVRERLLDPVPDRHVDGLDTRSPVLAPERAAMSSRVCR